MILSQSIIWFCKVHARKSHTSSRSEFSIDHQYEINEIEILYSKLYTLYIMKNMHHIWYIVDTTSGHNMVIYIISGPHEGNVLLTWAPNINGWASLIWKMPTYFWPSSSFITIIIFPMKTVRYNSSSTKLMRNVQTLWRSMNSFTARL